MTSHHPRNRGQRVCSFYNSYFEDGCRHGRNCRFQHLSSYEYAKFAIFRNDQNPPTLEAVAAHKEAVALRRDREYSQCHRLLERFVFDYPFNEDFLELYVHCCCMLKMPETNMNFKRLIAISPDNGFHHANYAVFLYRHQRPSNENAARRAFETALALCDRYQSSMTRSIAAKIHGHSANFFFEIDGDVERAKMHYEISLKTLESAKGLCHYAQLLRHIGYSQGAERTLKRCIEIGDEFIALRATLGLVDLLKDQQRYQEAEERLAAALK